jgi:small Trp-rich protein
MSEKSSSSGGIGVAGLLGVVFVTLKLIGIEPVASWSWLWVTSPFWLGFAILFVLFFVFIAIHKL